MSALKPSERSEVSVFNKDRVLGEFPLFYSRVVDKTIHLFRRMLWL